MEAVAAIYASKDSFISALNLQTELKDKTKANWYLVTSVDQSKLKEALELQEHAKSLLDTNAYIILNKCLQEKLNNWHPKDDDDLAVKLKASFTQRENHLKDYMKNKFNNVLEFTEIFKVSPQDHVIELSHQWDAISHQ